MCGLTAFWPLRSSASLGKTLAGSTPSKGLRLGPAYGRYSKGEVYCAFSLSAVLQGL